VTPSAKTIQFSFVPTGVAQTFYIVGIRANIGGLAAGTPVTATVTVEGGIGNRSNSNVVLGVVQQVLATAGTGFTGTSTLSITSCGPAIRTPLGSPATVSANPDPAGTGNSLRVSFAEGSLGAWTTAATSDSQVFASTAFAPAPAAGTQGTRFRVLLTNIPTNMQVYAPETIGAASLATTGTVTGGGGTVLTLVTGAAVDGSGGSVLSAPTANQYDLLTATGGQIAVTYEVTVAPIATALDTVTVFLAVTGTGPTGTGQISGLASLAPVAPPSNPAVPQFIAGKGATVANVIACVSYLLFPWAVTDGTYDTGLAIANTTSDPTGIGTTAQAGDVTLFFFPTNLADSSPAASFSQTISPTGGLKGGATATFDLNSLKTKPFYGYIIAVCNFTLAHGFAFIDTPNAGPASVAQGYIAVVINNPRIGSTSPVELGGR